ncbi:hypothetical protein [Rhodoferax sp.]|uniref:hypothetical protein n=1 Tax=Rhodoferax sp. TaxID=50421 RepID=UPI00272CAADE|nr:hypothetical protein [Rhodoferax sp.]
MIADTRITLSNSFQDGFQKIIFPTKNSFVAVSGRVGILKFLLDDLSKFLQQITPDARLDAFRTRLRERFKDIVRTGEVQGSEDGASFIYGDMKLENGPTRCRLMRFDLMLSDSGEPLIKEQTGASFSTEEAKKFPHDQRVSELPWLCTGTIPGTRNFIGNTAMDHVHQLLTRGLEISTDVDTETIKARGRVYQEVSVRGRSKPYGGNAAVVLSMTGPSDGSFRKKLRWFVNENEKKGAHIAVDVIQILGMAALKRIELLMTEIPGSIGLETVSDTWSLATISRRGGQQLVTGDDPNGVTLPFGLRRELG